jgi:hypothetical protein
MIQRDDNGRRRLAAVSIWPSSSVTVHESRSSKSRLLSDRSCGSFGGGFGSEQVCRFGRQYNYWKCAAPMHAEKPTALPYRLASAWA